VDKLWHADAGIYSGADPQSYFNVQHITRASKCSSPTGLSSR